MIVNELVTKFSFQVGNSFTKFNQNLNKSVKQTNQATGKMQSGFQRLGAALKKAGSFKINVLGSAQAKAILNNLKNQITAVKKTAQSPIGNMFSGMIGGAAGIAFLKQGLGALGEYQNGLNRLRIQYQDNTKAARVYNDLVKFAAKTPFELPEVVNAFSQLSAQGFDLDYAGLTALGDLASASNKSLEELVNAMLSAKRGHADMVDNFLGLSAKVKDGVMTATMENPDKTTTTKTFNTSDKKALLDFFIQAGKRKNVMGMMDTQSKTISGQFSTMADETKQLLVAGFKPLESTIAKAFEYLSKFTKEMKPLAIETGVFIKNNLPGTLKLIGQLLPVINTALAVMAFRFVNLKAMKLAEWAIDLAVEIKAVGVSAWFANTAIGFIPGLIIGAVAAIGLFAWDVVNYMNTGQSALLKFTEKWPWLHKIIKWAITGIIINFGALYDGIKKGVDFWMPKLKVAWDFVVKAFEWGFKNVIEPKFGWLFDMIGRIGGAIGPALEGLDRLFGMGNQDINVNANGGGGGSAPVSLGGGLQKHKRLADDLVSNGYKITTATKECLKAVWLTQQAALKGTSKITAFYAADAADQLARDQRFKEVKLTPEMYKRMMAGDKQLQEMFYGAQVIYNRKAGFSPTAGHGETWDTKNKKALYGRGATSMVRSDQMIQNARFFVPVEKAPANVTINQTINGGNPAAVSSATQRGIDNSGIGKTTGRQQPVRTAPGGIGVTG